MAKGIGQFKAQTLANFASPNLFRVEITSNNPLGTNSRIRERLSLVCHNAQIPGLTMVATDKDLTYRSNVRQKTYDDITLAFHCNDDMLELKYFQDWMENMVDPSTNRVGFYNNYIGTITVHKLSKQLNKNNTTDENATTLVTVINEAYPKRIEPLALDYSGTGVMSLSVNFSYRNYHQKWVSLKAGESPEIRGEPIAARSVDTEANKRNPMTEILDKTQNFKFRGDTAGSNDEFESSE